MLLINEPVIARRDCDFCQKYLHDHGESELPVKGRGGNPDELVPRSKGNVPPCRMPAVGCPKGTPENSKALTSDNMRAYRHYLECRATGRFPDDPIVQRNAGLFLDVEQSIARSRDEAVNAGLLALMQSLRVSAAVGG